MPHNHDPQHDPGTAHPTPDTYHTTYPDDLYDVYPMPDLGHLVYPLAVTDPALDDLPGPVAA